MPSKRNTAPKAVKPAPKVAAAPVPAAKAEALPFSCGSCPYYSGKATAAGNVCKRYPAGVLKSPTDWCGEHPDLAHRFRGISRP